MYIEWISPITQFIVNLALLFEPTNVKLNTFCCGARRPNSWTKSIRGLLFTVTSTALPWDFYFFKLTEPLTVSAIQLLYTIRNLKPENSQDYDKKPQRHCSFMISAPSQVAGSAVVKREASKDIQHIINALNDRKVLTPIKMGIGFAKMVQR